MSTETRRSGAAQWMDALGQSFQQQALAFTREGSLHSDIGTVASRQTTDRLVMVLTWVMSDARESEREHVFNYLAGIPNKSKGNQGGFVSKYLSRERNVLLNLWHTYVST